jgi:hypothetical protein
VKWATAPCNNLDRSWKKLSRQETVGAICVTEDKQGETVSSKDTQDTASGLWSVLQAAVWGVDNVLLLCLSDGNSFYSLNIHFMPSSIYAIFHTQVFKSSFTTLAVSLQYLDQNIEGKEYKLYVKKKNGWIWWFTPVISAVSEAEIWRIVVWGQPGKKLARPHLNQQAGPIVEHLWSQLCRRH